MLSDFLRSLDGPVNASVRDAPANPPDLTLHAKVAYLPKCAAQTVSQTWFTLVRKRLLRRRAPIASGPCVDNAAGFGKQEGYHAPHIIRNGTVADDSRMRWVGARDRSNAVHLRP